MDITVSGKHIEVTPAIREYAESKVAKLPRYYDRVSKIDVLADSSNHTDGGVEVEIIVHVEKSAPFVVKIESNDLYACIDDAVDNLERRLTQHKDKKRNRKHSAPK